MLWLWCRPAAVALIRPLAREPPYAIGVALESKKIIKIKKNQSIAHYKHKWESPFGTYSKSRLN